MPRAWFRSLALAFVTVLLVVASLVTLQPPLFGTVLDPLRAVLPLSLSAAPPGANRVETAWRRAQAAGSFRVRADIEQTLLPRATPQMIGQQGQRIVMRAEGAVHLPDQSMLQLWVEGGGTKQPPVTLVHQAEQTFIQKGDEVKPVADSPTRAAAPGGDYLAWLAIADNVQPLEATTAAGQSFTRYSFEVTGTRLAETMREQMEEAMRRSGDLPDGVRLAPATDVARLNARGEIWIDENGLPRRQILDTSLPGASDDYDVSAHITMDYRDFGKVAELPRAVQGSDGGADIARLWILLGNG